MKLHKAMKLNLLLAIVVAGSISQMQGMEPSVQPNKQAVMPLSLEEVKALIAKNLDSLDCPRFGEIDLQTPEQKVHQVVDLFLNHINALSEKDLSFMIDTIKRTYFYCDRLLMRTLIKRFDELAAHQMHGLCVLLVFFDDCSFGSIISSDYYYSMPFYSEIRNLVHKNIVHFTRHKHYFDSICSIVGMKTICASLADSIEKINPTIVAPLFKSTKDLRLARAILRVKQNFDQESIVLAEEIVQRMEYSPTQRHLSAYSKAQDLEKKFIYNSDLNGLYDDFLKKEKELNKSGYYTFAHGQRRELYCSERLYTFLWGQRKNQSVQNFLFAHVKDLVATEEARFQEDILRKTIRVAGTQQDSFNKNNVDAERRKLVLFMNYALFANTTVRGSSSSYYVYNDHNSPSGSNIKLSGSEPFSLLGYEWLYKKYSTEIDKLCNDYAMLSRFGNLLLIAVPKDTVNKYVYLAETGGIPRVIRIEGIGKTCDIKLILETLINNPEKIEEMDTLEFCLIMTQKKGGLDPSTGIQVHPLLSRRF